MKSAELLEWFNELQAGKPAQYASEADLTEQAVAWQAGVASAISAAFPPGHRIFAEWTRAAEPKNPKPILDFGLARAFEDARWSAMSGVFSAAHAQLRAGRVEGFVDSVRAEAESEVLEQADTLREGGFLAAAAVLVGGALETHLRRLCERNTLLPSGHGSIDKYNTAIAQARNNGLTIYEKADQSLVTAWGQTRNEAAHDPAKFASTRTEADVRSMIDGVRLFVTKTR